MNGLPHVMGAMAALMVAFVSLMTQAQTGVFAMRTVSAFMVFYAFGLVIRHLIVDAMHRQAVVASAGDLPDIEPGTRVEDLLQAEDDR